MPRKMDLSLLDQMLDSGSEFEITPAEYERIIGKAMPETEDYFLYKSPVAKAARVKGFKIRLEDRQIIQRIIKFEKRDRL